ncbi:MAG: hypothetical protein KDA33_17630, partial [Phycisphaerales bacterium]|nr:hypothetical protein [Phycisphaerales bacterium]
MTVRISAILILALLVLVGLGGVGRRANADPTTQPASAASEAGASASEEILIPGLRLDDADALLITHYARRAFTSGFKGRDLGGDPYVPPSLEGKSGVAYVTLWRSGVVMASGVGEDLPVIQATMTAAHAAGKAMMAEQSADATACRDCGLEIEWLGPDEMLSGPYFNQGATYTPELLGAMDPGVDGIGVDFNGRRGRTPASDIIQRHYSPDVAIIAAEGKVGLTLEDKLQQPEKIHYFRCPSVHLWQPDAKAKPVRLLRGEPLVPPDSIDARSVEKAIERTGGYLLYRQNSNGAFSHEYVPSADRYLNASDALVQLRSVFGGARLAAYRKDIKSEQGAANGIAAFAAYLEDLNFQISTAEEGEKIA